MADETTRKPTMFIIVGPNGGGKSTLYDKVIRPKLPNTPFLNADIVQRDELKKPDPAASYQAQDVVNQRRDKLISEGKSFVYETVFSHPTKLDIIADAKAVGHNVVLYHVGLQSPELAVKRVDLRVAKGGHPVPEDKIRGRFERNQPLIREAANMADRAFIYDNSVLGRKPSLGIEFEKGNVVSISENLQKWQSEIYSQDLTAFSPQKQNSAAASYAQVERVAAEVYGAPVNVKIPQKGQTYNGPFIGEADMHFLQKTGNSEFVGHFKSIVGEDAILGKPLSVKYETAKKVIVKPLSTQDVALLKATEAAAGIKNPKRRAEAMKAVTKLRQLTLKPTKTVKQAIKPTKSKGKDFGLGD